MSELRTSEQLDALAAALAKAQGNIGTAAFDRENPHFRSRYATLESVYAACRGALAAQGLAVVQALADGPTGRLALTTRLLHASGQWLESTVSVGLDKGGAQALGSAATYLRRYALVSLVGVATGEDDDGEGAEGRETGPRGGVRESASAKAARQAKHHASWEADRARFAAACAEVGVPVDDVAGWCEAHGRPRPSAMAQDQRDKLRAWLADHHVEVTEWAARGAA